ncbi:hypothetical protein BDR03DRAFT_108893 [Suillus americanus]|nr:hypothetical protein BDR03DRAFT_108893 [Suillus americanus]
MGGQATASKDKTGGSVGVGVWGIVIWCGEWELSLGVGVHVCVWGRRYHSMRGIQKVHVFKSCGRHSMTQPNKKRKGTTRMGWTWDGMGWDAHARYVYEHGR